MRLVVLESRYAAGSGLRGLIGRWLNRRYARRCVRDSLLRGESPCASHLLFTQPGILNDADPAEREWGIRAGLAWRTVAEASVVYVDRGVSSGMRAGIMAMERQGKPVEYRSLAQRGLLMRQKGRGHPSGPLSPETRWRAPPEDYAAR